MKNSLIALLISAFICFLSVAFCIVDVKNTNALVNNNYPVIIIDAGHGGVDGGAVAEDGTNEKDINLKIALKLNEFFTIMGYETRMVRYTDISIHNNDANTIREKKVSDIRNRTAIMEEYENCLYISIHQNKFDDSSVWGAQTFYSPNNENSKVLAMSIQTSIANTLQPENKRQIKPSGTSIYVLYNATKPAVMVECGFISNFNELAQLKNDEYQSKIAFSIMSGIINYNVSEVANDAEV